MWFDWNGNGQKDDMFDNMMDYMLASGEFDKDDDDDEGEEE